MRGALLAKYDVPVPRYTSYPTAPQWSDTPEPDEWRASLAASIAPAEASLSVYVHVPFCESLCTFCGCNTVITRDHGREVPYVDLVLRELDTYLDTVPSLAGCPVGHVHLGGGTPTFLAPASLERLAGELRRRLPARGDHFEGSIEADPRVTSVEHLAVLASHGFRRLSLGVQDFDQEVQGLVNRRQSFDLVRRLTSEARDAGYESVNFDLIYGLPGQTPASTRHLADQVTSLRPDRLAVYSFARVPWIKPAQRKFRDDQVPAGAEKRALYEILRERLPGSLRASARLARAGG
jgi:oxygen-independent coproporphyrinogen-3 oxidase